MERRAFGRMLGGWLAGVAVLPVLLGRRAAGKPTRKREPASDDYPPVIEWPLYDIRDPRFESSDISGGLPLGAVVRFTIVRYDYSTPASLKWARKAWCGYWVLTSKYTPAKPPLISNLTSFIRHTPVGRRPTHADVARILAEADRPAPHEDTSAHILPRDKFTFPPVWHFPLYDIEDPLHASEYARLKRAAVGTVFRMFPADVEQGSERAKDIRNCMRQSGGEYIVLAGWFTIPAGRYGNDEPKELPTLHSFMHRPTYADVKRILAEEART